MTVVAVYHEQVVTEGKTYPGLKSLNSCTLLCQSVLWNCSAYVEQVKDQLTAKGNVSEVGMINFLMDSGIQVKEILESKSQIFSIPFNSYRKRQTTVVLDNSVIKVFVKGAPEIILELCNSYVGLNGKKLELD